MSRPSPPLAMPSGPHAPTSPRPVAPESLASPGPDARPTRAGSEPAEAGPRPAERRPSSPARWLSALLGRARDAAELLGSSPGSRVVHEFADLVESARKPEKVEAALVRYAGTLADAHRVELLLDRDGNVNPAPKLMAVWPEDAPALSMTEVEALGYPLCLGLWCGDHYQMTLQLYSKPGRGGQWPKRVVRRLTTLCAMAAAAERGMHAGRRARVESPGEAAVRDATFLNAILPYALSQAQRHREPLTVFCIEIDRLGALRQSHGPEVVDLTVRRAAESVAGTLRGSDVIARLDDDRVFVVLPNTGSADAMTVAVVVRSALSTACQSPGRAPAVTASLGVSCFPEDGSDMFALLAAADEAMNRARAKGVNQVAMYSLPASQATPSEVVLERVARVEGKGAAVVS